MTEAGAVQPHGGKHVWVMVPKSTGQVFVYDNEAAAIADSTSGDDVRRVHVDHEAVTR